ncbi:MAG: hypothetical protein J6583_10195 [Gilliamella sp.]|nr:hypothetical protein [Gilliamella sp.]
MWSLFSGYNAAERLSRVSNDTREVASYQYDPFGRRISKTVNGETTYYIYSSEGLLAELDQNGKMRVAYGWKPDSDWGTSPLWQANLSEGQTLKCQLSLPDKPPSGHPATGHKQRGRTELENQ